MIRPLAFRLVAPLLVLAYAAIGAPALAQTANPVRDSAGVPYAHLLGQDGVNPLSSTNPFPASIGTFLGLTSLGAKTSANSISVALATDTVLNFSTLNAITVGDVAAGQTDGGSAPIKIGAVYNATPPTYTAGQRSQLQTDLNGNLLTRGGGITADQATDTGVAPVKGGCIVNTTTPSYTAGQDANDQCDSRGNRDVTIRSYNGSAGALVSSPATGLSGLTDYTLFTTNFPELFNGATFDPQTNNQDLGALVTLAAQAAGSGVSTTQYCYDCRGVIVQISITAITSGTLVVTVQNYDAGTATYATVLTSASLSTTGVTTLSVYPGITATANVSASAPVARRWRVSWTVTGSSVTAVVGANIVH